VEIASIILVSIILENLDNLVAIAEDEDGWLDGAYVVRRVDIQRCADDHFVADLATAGRSTVKNTTYPDPGSP
jgi:hypothetical protein